MTEQAGLYISGLGGLDKAYQDHSKAYKGLIKSLYRPYQDHLSGLDKAY